MTWRRTSPSRQRHDLGEAPADRRAVEPLEPAAPGQVLLDAQLRVEGDVLGQVADSRRIATESRTGRGRRASRAGGRGRKPVIMRMVVVLPAPFGPACRRSPLGHREGDTGDGGEGAELRSVDALRSFVLRPRRARGAAPATSRCALPTGQNGTSGARANVGPARRSGPGREGYRVGADRQQGQPGSRCGCGGGRLEVAVVGDEQDGELGRPVGEHAASSPSSRPRAPRAPASAMAGEVGHEGLPEHQVVPGRERARWRPRTRPRPAPPPAPSAGRSRAARPRSRLPAERSAASRSGTPGEHRQGGRRMPPARRDLREVGGGEGVGEGHPPPAAARRNRLCSASIAPGAAGQAGRGARGAPVREPVNRAVCRSRSAAGRRHRARRPAREREPRRTVRHARGERPVERAATLHRHRGERVVRETGARPTPSTKRSR